MNEAELKRYLGSPENKQKITDAAKFYQIDSKQLNNIIQRLVDGEVSFEEFSATLVDELGISFDLALKVVLDLDEKIFAKVREDLDRIREGSPGKDWKQFLPDAMAEDLLNNLPGYSIWDNNLKIRFTEAIVSWLRDLRDVAELKDFLLKSPKIGGLGMSEEAFDQLSRLLTAKKEAMVEKHIDIAKVMARYDAEKGVIVAPSVVKEDEIDVAAKPEAKEPLQPKVTGADVTISQLLQTKGIDYEELASKEATKQALQKKTGNLAAVIEAKEEFLESKKEIAPSSPAVPAPPALPIAPPVDYFSNFEFAEPAVQPVVPPPPPPPVPPQPVQPAPVSPAPPKPFFRPQPGTRPKMEDVKYSPYLYGPIEELASLTINDLRRLSKDPKEAVSKIVGKLDLLEDESLNKRADGVKALKKSPLYGLYADIMDRAILHGKPFEQILAETKSMSMEEFRAIMDLNKDLKY